MRKWGGVTFIKLTNSRIDESGQFRHSCPAYGGAKNAIRKELHGRETKPVTLESCALRSWAITTIFLVVYAGGNISEFFTVRRLL